MAIATILRGLQGSDALKTTQSANKRLNRLRSLANGFNQFT